MNVPPRQCLTSRMLYPHHAKGVLKTVDNFVWKVHKKCGEIKKQSSVLLR
jgi:hypothetical protein